MSADKASSTQARRACSEELSSELPTRCFVIPESNADVTETQTVEENNASASTSASAVMHEGSISMKPQETEHSESSTKCGIDITTDGVESSNLQVNDSKAIQNETEQLMEDGEITETGNDKKEHKCKKKHGHKCSKHKVKNANEKQVTEDAHCPSKSRHKHKNKHKHKHKHSRDGNGEKKKSKSKDRASKANSGKRRSGSSERHNKSQKEDERHKREGSFWRGYSQLPDVVSSARTKEMSRAKRARADDSEDDDAFWGGFTPREGWRSPSPAKDIAACDFLPVEQIPLPPRRAAAAYTSEPRCKKIEIRMTSKAGPDRYSSLSTAPESASHSLSEKRPGADPALKFLTSLCKTISERDREEELRTRGRRKNDVTRTRFDREPAQGSRFRTDILAGTNVAGPRADGNAAVPPWLMPAHKQVAIARANQDALKQQFPISTGEEHKVVIENFSTDTVEPQAEDSDLDAIQQTRKHTEMDRRIRETLGQFTKHRLLYLPEQEALAGEEQIGKRLLEKMGWKEGTGLGKNRDGPLQPLMLGVKLDRKGLLSTDEQTHVELPLTLTATNANIKAPDLKLIAVPNATCAPASVPTSVPVPASAPVEVRTASTRWDGIPGAPPSKCFVVASKHPVSVLYEFCQKNKLPPPLITEKWDSHLSGDGFYAVVNVDNHEFQGKYARTKKQARANGAVAALEGLGFVPPGLQWAA